MAISDPESGFHGTLTGALQQQMILDLPVDEASTAALDAFLDNVPRALPRSLLSRWCRARAACAFMIRESFRRCEGSPIVMSCY
jgi:hypothetical protein